MPRSGKAKHCFASCERPRPAVEGRTPSEARGPTHKTTVGFPQKKSHNSTSCGFSNKILAVSYSHRRVSNGCRVAARQSTALPVANALDLRSRAGPRAKRGAPHIKQQWGFPKRKAATQRAAASQIRSWRCPTLTWGNPTLPSALYVFTSEFGMGSGGSRTLLPPGKLADTKGVRFIFNSSADCR